MQAKGTLGLIATNTVAQGDSREVGLDTMVAGGFTITRAIQSRSWPAASANLEYAAVWGTLDDVAEDVPRIADEIKARQVSTLLEPAGRVEGNPLRLRENAGVASIGCYVLGMGFVIDPEEAQEWIAADARNAEVLFPYLNGEDLNSRPDASASRWVIDFSDRPLAEAEQYPVPLDHVIREAKPERERGPRKAYRDRWWQFAEKQMSMRHAIQGLPEVLVIALVSNTVMPVRVPTGQVFSHKLGVFATDSYANQGVLSSSVHQLWVVKYTSTLGAGINYSPSDVFETFPLPAVTEQLSSAGHALDDVRREIMGRRSLGLTKLYNLVNDAGLADSADPDIARLRALHVTLDQAVLDSYGWSDIRPDHGFHLVRKVNRWTVDPAARLEILDRLLELNRLRAGKEDASTGASRSNAIELEGLLFD